MIVHIILFPPLALCLKHNPTALEDSLWCNTAIYLLGVSVVIFFILPKSFRGEIRDFFTDIFGLKMTLYSVFISFHLLFLSFKYNKLHLNSFIDVLRVTT